MTERWAPVAGFEHYEVSDLGRLRRGERILRCHSNTHGYFKFTFVRGPRGAPERKTIRVHRVVALTFIPNPEGKLEVNHIDGNRANNAASNLEWTTSTENYAHAVRLGRHSSETNPKRIQKLTPEAREQCKRRFAAGEKISVLAREFGMTWACMSRAVKGQPPQKYIPRPGAHRSKIAREQAAARREARMAQLIGPAQEDQP